MPRQTSAQLGRKGGFAVAPSNEGKMGYDLADVMAESPMLASSPTNAGVGNMNARVQKSLSQGTVSGKETPPASVPADYKADLDSIAE